MRWGRSITSDMRMSMICGLVAVLTAGSLLLTGCSDSEAGNDMMARPDVIVIDAMLSYGPLDRPPVEFPHDLHTAHMTREGDECSRCHTEIGAACTVPKFHWDRTMSRTQVTDLYHDSCITCHQTQLDAGSDSGPVVCGECHREQPQYISARQNINFDKSLHYRHIKALDNTCDKCHHDYNPETGELEYMTGHESSCRDCHGDAKQGDACSMRTEAHNQCISCHRETVNSGPVECAGCHDPVRLAKIEKVEDVPRLDRNQPDFVLLAAPEGERELSKLNTVPFSHVGHEGFLDDCRTCHHLTLKACNECHNLTGSEDANGVGLQQAFHLLASKSSCIGCHDDEKTAFECGGCHRFMQQRTVSERACRICHSGPAPERLEAVGSRYTSLEQFKPSRSEYRLSFSKSEIPDTVWISVLEDQYEPALLPHRKIIDAMLTVMQDNKVANHFHATEDIVCQGCHHHSPIGTRPPLCENCHGEPFDSDELHKPGLYGAYHRQCIGCHESMKISKPQECTVCHARKSGA